MGLAHKAGTTKSKPAIFFITTSDTEIGEDVIKRASNSNVELFQIIALVNSAGGIGFTGAIPVPLKPAVPLFVTTKAEALPAKHNDKNGDNPEPAPDPDPPTIKQ